MKHLLCSLTILLVFSCDKNPVIPDCIENMKAGMIERVDSDECDNLAYIDEYSFQGYYVYYIPIICTSSFVGTGKGGIYKDDCSYMSDIGFQNETEFDGEKFSETAVFERRIWSYGE